MNTYSISNPYITRTFFIPNIQHIQSTRWAPTSYKWGHNSYRYGEITQVAHLFSAIYRGLGPMSLHVFHDQRAGGPPSRDLWSLQVSPSVLFWLYLSSNQTCNRNVGLKSQCHTFLSWGKTRFSKLLTCRYMNSYGKMI